MRDLPKPHRLIDAITVKTSAFSLAYPYKIEANDRTIKNRVPNAAHDLIIAFYRSIPKATWGYGNLHQHHDVIIKKNAYRLNSAEAVSLANIR